MLGACLALALSCKEKPVEEDVAPKVELPAETQALFDQGIHFEAEEGLMNATLRFTVNKPWAISLAEGKPSKALSWLSVSPESGPAGEAVVQVVAQPNNTTQARTAVLTLTYGEQHKQLTVTQEGKEETPPEPPTPVKVEKVTLSAQSLELLVGETAELSYVVEPENADIESVTWSSSDTAVAAVAEGKVTAVAAGQAVITLKVNDKEATCAVAVETPFVAVESITLSMTEVSLLEGTDYQLTATVLPENATDPSVTWATSDEAVATVENGLVKALKEGTAVISAKAGEQEARCTVTVEKDFVPVSSITLSASQVELLPGESAVLTATVLPEDATDPSVTWESSDENVATVEDGKVTAVAPGSAVITARAGNESARCSILVDTPFVPVTSIPLAPTEITLEEGGETNLTASVLPADATDPHVDFTSSDTAVATVDDGGKVKAVAPGSAVITAKAGDCEARCQVTVTARPVPVESVSLNKSSLTLETGEGFDLVATVKPDNATDPAVTWTSSDPSVASVTENGHVEALQPGQAVITAKAGEKEATCAVTVNAPYVPVEGITLDRTELTLSKGDKTTLTATVLPADATDPTVTWTSSANRYVTVDANGTLTAVRVGTAVITAKAGDYSATCTVTVTTPATSISLNYSTYTMRPREELQMVVSAKPTGAVVSGVVWTSSNPAAATIDDNGLVTAVKSGSSVVTATMGDLEATCIIVVSEDATGGNEGTGTEVWE